MKKYQKKEKLQCREIYRYITNHSDAFVLLTETHKRYIEKLLDSRLLSNLHVIPNPLTFTRTINSKEIEKKKNTVLIVGRMDDYYKRITLLLKVWKGIDTKGWTLKIVGDGPDIKKYKDFANNHHLNNIIFYGKQYPEKFYEEAKIFLMASKSEGLPMTISDN